MTTTMIFDAICSLHVYFLIPNQAILKKPINFPECFYKVRTIVGGCHHDFAFNLKLSFNIVHFFDQDIIRLMAKPTTARED